MPHLLRSCLVFLCLAVPAQADVPMVVTDIAPIHSMVAMVMGDFGTPDLMVDTATGPHSGALRPSQARALQDADLVIWIGPELAPWLEGPVETLAPNATRLDLLDAAGTKVLTFREADEVGHDEDGHDDGDHDEEGHDEDHQDEAHHDEHDHAAGDEDPHAWLDPDNAVVWLGLIADLLAQADPERAADYRSNAASAQQDINDLAAEIASALAPMQKQPFITLHDAYQYFEMRFGLESIGFVTASDASDPSPAGLARLSEKLKQADVSCAFSAPQYDPGLLYAAAGEKKLKVIPLDPLGAELAPGPDLYTALLRDMAQAVSSCME